MPLLILIAEDEPAIRLSISDYLELSGYSVVAAQNGEEALLMVEKYHPHLLISDIVMPKKDGYELVKEIRKLPQYRLLPIVLLTERKKTDDRIRGYQVGCDAYLPKPFEMEELEAIIRNLLERSQIVNSELIFSQGNHGTSQNISYSLPESDRDAAVKSNQQELREKLELTQREQEVLKLLIKGCSNIEIGQKLHLSHRTIEKYVSSLLRKSDKNNRIELIRFALEYY
ncbi:response regulator transcription factor [Pleurocapsales cyanobacterium LEGE 10410]|nr:response regulator transcription factor [Pleurocapsales cyanobacterium LEGE 10410]